MYFGDHRMAGHIDHLLNSSSKRFGQLDDLPRKAFIKKHPTENWENQKKIPIQLRRQDETSDFFLGISACFGADAEVPRRPDERHLKKEIHHQSLGSPKLINFLTLVNILED